MDEKRGSESGIVIDENIAGLLCYLLMGIMGIIFLIIEEENDFVRFHAMQSIFVFLPLIIFYRILSFSAPLSVSRMGFSILGVIGALVMVLIIVLWIVLTIKAYQGERYKLPIAGDIAENLLN